MNQVTLPLALIWLAITIGIPGWLYSHHYAGHDLGDWATWVGALAVGWVGLFAIPQLSLTKASTEVDVFLRACGIIDDERVFGPNYQLIRDSESMLQKAALSEDGKSLIGISGYDSRLPNAVQDVLSALEQVGIIFHYATNKNMIEEYVGDIAINAYEALRNVLEDQRRKDGHMYERFVELYEYCHARWNTASARRITFTNVTPRP